MTKVDQLTTEVNLLRTDVASLTNLITKTVIPNVLTAVDALDGVVAATDATVEELQTPVTAIDQSLQGATGGSGGTSPATSTRK